MGLGDAWANFLPSKGRNCGSLVISDHILHLIKLKLFGGQIPPRALNGEVVYVYVLCFPLSCKYAVFVREEVPRIGLLP